MYKYIPFLLGLLLLFQSCKRNKFEFECSGTPNVYSGDLKVKSITTFKEDAGRPEYSADGNYISYHKKGDDGFYDVYISDADGENEVCLTCNANGFPGKHAGNPSWHPSGDYIVFQAEMDEYYTDKNHGLAHPGVGFNNDVYLIRLSDGKIWPLTDIETKQSFFDKTPFRGVLHPHFSNDGNLISWAEKVDKGGEWGEWKIVVAGFGISSSGTPQLTNRNDFQPGEQDLYYETNDFSLDDSKLIICGNLEKGQREVGMDLYEMDVRTGDLEQITTSYDKWDESGHYSPDGTMLAYIGSKGYTTRKGKKWWKWGKAEFWLMNADGSGQYPITFWNCPDSDEFMDKQVMPAYIVWRPDGMALLAGIVIGEGKNELRDRLVMIELEK